MISQSAKKPRKRTFPDSDGDSQEEAGAYLPVKSNTEGLKRSLPTRSRNKLKRTSLSKTKAQDVQTKTRKHAPTANDNSISKTKTTRSIPEFFTQAPRGSHTSRHGSSISDLGNGSPVTIPVDYEEDVIEDSSEGDVSEEPTRTLSRSSSRHNGQNDILKGQRQTPALAANSTFLAGSQKFRKIEKNESVQNGARLEKGSQRPWTELFAPQNLEELAVHKKKIQDVREWLERSFMGNEGMKMLVLRGPAGAGKTSTIKLLAQSMNIDILEWKNPLGSDMSQEGYVSMSAQFEDFLGRSHRYGGLEMNMGSSAFAKGKASDQSALRKSHRGKIVLLEEFPSILTQNSIALQSFRQSMLQYLASFKPADTREDSGGLATHKILLVLIITESRLSSSGSSNENFTMNRLLGPDILNYSAVSVIDFNSVAVTILQKALDLVLQKEARLSGRRRVPGSALLKELCASGDITSAICSLEFLCIRGSDDIWSGRIAAKGKKSAQSSKTEMTEAERQTLGIVTPRESSLGLFHAVGKVVYNKRTDLVTGNSTQSTMSMASHHDRTVPEASLHDLMSECGTDVDTFVAALHENYLLSCTGDSFTEASGDCLEILSDADLLGSSSNGRSKQANRNASFAARLDAVRQEEVIVQLAVRGIQYHLPYPVKRSPAASKGVSQQQARLQSHKMFYPYSLRLWKKIEEIDDLLDQWHQSPNNPASSHIAPHTQERSISASTGTTTHSPIRPDTGEAETSVQPRSLSFSSKTDLILDELPYVYKIEASRAPHSDTVRDLRAITQFSDGVDILSEDADEEEPDVGVLGGGAGGRGGKGKGSDPKTWEEQSGRGDKGAGRGRGGASKMPGSRVSTTTATPAFEEEIGNLYLVDDDIED